MCKFPLTGCLQIIYENFFAKLVQSVSLCHRLSKNLTTESGSKQRFSLLQEKAVIQAVCLRTPYKSPVLGLKGGLWVFRKSQKMLTASDQYFLSYVKKNYKGGSPPPPAGIGLK